MSGERELLRRSPRFRTPNVRMSPRLSNVGAILSEQTRTPDGSKMGDEKTRKRSLSLLALPSVKKIDNLTSSKKKQKIAKRRSFFIGDPIPADEAQERWRWRYVMKSQRCKGKGLTSDDNDDEDKIVLNVEFHYAQAHIGECILHLGDCAYIKGEGARKHVGRILEFFRTTDGEDYFRVQWFYRAEDTVIKEAAAFHDKRRLFYSTVMNDNPLDCIISKVSITQMPPGINLKSNSIPPSGFYYDMEYCVEYSTFRTLRTDDTSQVHDLSITPYIETVSTSATASSLQNLPHCESEDSAQDHDLSITPGNETVSTVATAISLEKETDNSPKVHDLSITPCFKAVSTTTTAASLQNMPHHETYKARLVLLDLYSGCGGMSTGLCLGAKVSCIDLVTRWALDIDRSACESLKLNHPETQVRNEAAEDFLELLKEWKKLCKRYVVNKFKKGHEFSSRASRVPKSNVTYPNDADTPPGEYEVESIVDICYGDPNKTGKRGLNFKVHWKGYAKSEDTWEQVDVLSNCGDCIRDFVRNGFNAKILPLPGDVDVICGGPPCQGISGYNRFRNVDSPLDDERNRQIIVFMDIAEFLKPKFVLMENVTDILRFDKASLGRYALSRLVHMKYQARLGIIAAGCYGLPQFRLRVFLWGAHHNEKLPQFPLPTHDVIVRYWPPPEFERNTVAYDEGQPRELEKALVLQDAISDLPAVKSHEVQEEISYEKPPETEFQRFIRSSKSEMTGSAFNGTARLKNSLYDHRTYQLSEDDYIRVCQIPKRKGANFRDLPGVVVGADNVVRRDPTKDQVLLPSGKPMVPDYAFNFEQGKSKRPFARLWWDETVPTVVTFPSLHNMAALHPEQDRVLTIRECARLQGFPDYYRFYGTVKERYCQVGNAVPVFVARALGYAMGIAFQKLSSDKALITLPPKFSLSTNLQLANSLLEKTD